MARIIPHTTTADQQTKPHFNDLGVHIGDIKEIGPSIGREPNFAELHALYEIQYEQFLTDTNDEIAKRAQRLLELKSIVYGHPSPK